MWALQHVIRRSIHRPVPSINYVVGLRLASCVKSKQRMSAQLFLASDRPSVDTGHVPGDKRRYRTRPALNKFVRPNVYRPILHRQFVCRYTRKILDTPAER